MVVTNIPDSLIFVKMFDAGIFVVLWNSACFPYLYKESMELFYQRMPIMYTSGGIGSFGDGDLPEAICLMDSHTS